MDHNWISIVPSILAIVVAIYSRQVILALLGGVILGHILLNDGNILAGIGASLDGILTTLQSPGNLKVILFTFLIGMLITTIEQTGGIAAFVKKLTTSRFTNTPRKARALPFITGILIFIESNITVLVSGAIARPIFDKFKISREKLAYIVDSTCAPICVLIPLNAWGAYNVGLVQNQGVENAVGVFAQSILFNFYAIAAILVTLFTIIFNWNIGPMKAAEQRTQNGQVHWPDSTPMMATESDPNHIKPSYARNMILPILAMFLTMPVALYLTGDGNITAGSGSTSALWAVIIAVLVSWVLSLMQKQFNTEKLTQIGLKGAGSIMPMAVILLFSLALGDVSKLLHAGDYMASLLQTHFHPAALLPLMFVLGGLIAFSTGTSWGTFALMMPIAIPTAMAAELPVAPFIAAAISGGIFGDHASPISDTTIVSSMASATDHIDHVRTQLPYAMLSGVIALTLFSITGVLIA
ncbi:Na+/H+ antiporter NhaC family protein [Flocculibacter collagenilyticus]|uniref:Na+/H+ antiporter NhaC family protein n=1 Tax=Flocculibacter collagenilyticus TaxID=2744479 RepID=UPI0018F38B01|nr:Na+/H+ antiporter NhaC family protein [Flocculibacter collagenilyticus]